MKYYELLYVYDNNGETGVTHSIDIARTKKKEDILKLLADNKLNYVTDLERGESHVFWIREFEPKFETYIDNEQLRIAINMDTDYRVAKAEEAYEWKLFEQRAEELQKELGGKWNKKIAKKAWETK